MLMRPIKYIYNRINRRSFAALESLEKSSAEIQSSLLEINNRINSLEKRIPVELAAQSVAIDHKIVQAANIFSIQTITAMKLKGKNDKKRILIAGFYGAANLGDEIMLESMLDSLKQNKDIDITVMLSDNYQPDLTRYGAYNFMVYPSQMLDINIMANYFDGMIVAGGALLDDTDYDISAHIFSLDTAIICLSERLIKFGKSCCFYGLSTNQTITNPEYIKKLDAIIQNCTYFSIRDTNSLKIINDICINTEKIKIVNDLIFTNHLLANLQPKKPLDTSIIKKVGLIYIFTDQNYSDLLKFTQKLLDYSEPNVQFNIIPFYDFRNSDYIFAKKLIDDIGSNRLSVCNNIPKTYTELITVLSENDAIISMRYHGTLMSNILNRKVLCVNYDTHSHYGHKNAYIYDNYGFRKMMIDFSKIDSFAQKDYNNFTKLTEKNIDIKKIYRMATDEIKIMLNAMNLK